jgi:hypothetical protein
MEQTNSPSDLALSALELGEKVRLVRLKLSKAAEVLAGVCQ